MNHRWVACVGAAALFSQPLCAKDQAPVSASGRADPCLTGLPANESLRLHGVSRSGKRPGEALMWLDPEGLIRYVESFSWDADEYRLEGSIRVGANGESWILTSRAEENGRELASENINPSGDSLMVVRGDSVTLEPVTLRLPDRPFAPLVAVLTQCALNMEPNTLRTAALGTLRALRLATTVVTDGARSRELELYALSSDSIWDLGHVWLDEDRRLFAYPFAEGVMDLLPPEWQSVRGQLIDAEVLASRPPAAVPSCAGGHGLGSCENSTYLCRLTTPGGAGGSFTLTDDPQFTVRSDGLGPYVSGSTGIRVIAGAIAGLTVARRTDGSPFRSFTVDLNHAVPGGGGTPLGVIVADGWPGPFTPAGGDYFVEIAAQWFTEEDYTQHSLQDVPVGSTVPAEQLDLDFYVDGVHHVLQMGPQPTGHCFSDGTAIHGDGTTGATISRPTETRWIVDLPPGSIGRLFENHIADRFAVDRGLYYVAVRFVIER